jgi:hypothetical protein
MKIGRARWAVTRPRPFVGRYVVTEAFVAALEVGDGSALADLVEIGASKIAICQPLGEHAMGGDEYLVGDGESASRRGAPWGGRTWSWR